MVKFDVKVDIPSDILGEPGTKTEHFLAVQAMKDTAPYVPFLTGSLNTRTRVDGSEIIYPGPYARYLYYGKLMVDPNTGSSFASLGATKKLTNKDLVFNQAYHPMAQARWFEASKSANMDKWDRVAGRTMKRELDG